MASPSKGKTMYNEVMIFDTEEKMGEHVPDPSENNVPSGDQIQGTFIYDEDRMMDGFAKLILLDDLPLNLGESGFWISYVQNALQPEYEGVSSNEVKVRIKNAYKKYKKALREYFVKFDGRVVITSDVWSRFGDESCGYVCVCCHWIDNDWKMQKRIVGFEYFDDECTDDPDVEVVSKMTQVLCKFKLKGKVFAVSCDNATSEEKCVKYLSTSKDFEPVVQELFSHHRSCAYAVDLCAQHAVDQLDLLINPIRKLIEWIRLAMSDKRLEFKALCENVGLKPRHFYLDFPGNWRSTYEVLSVSHSYREVLTKLYNESVSECSIVESQWQAISSILDLLEKFSCAAHTFLKVYSASCHLVIHECINIVHTLKAYENDPLLGFVVRDMKSKWLEHFPDFPIVYCIATMLDPRIKVDGLQQLLVYYYETLGVNCSVDDKLANCKNILNQLHAHYASKRKREAKMAQSMSEAHMTSGSRKGKEKHHSSSSIDLVMNIVKKNRKGNEGDCADLDEYLSFEFNISDDDFDILQWWKKREELFPVLSKIAKDILCTPVSTVAPESASCAGKRVLDEKRSMYDPDMLRACICQKDWYMAEEGIQGLRYSDDDPDPWISDEDEGDL